MYGNISFNRAPRLKQKMEYKMKWRNLLAVLTENDDDNRHNIIEQIRRESAEEPMYIQPYLGYGTRETFYLRGRVLEGEKLRVPTEDDTLWENLAATYQRFESDEVPAAQVEITVGAQRHEVVTDGEGYFVAEISAPPMLVSERADELIWHDAALSILLPTAGGIGERDAFFETTANVMVPTAHSKFGVISDLDDTVLQTNATNLLKMARLTLLRNARTRLPFAGVAEFYQALQRGPQGRAQNPIFYVSSSPWNLYDLLIEFLDFHGIPHGPLFLRDLGFSRELIRPSGHHSHKLAQIEHLLRVYPNLPFILIGDSGQEDPEIYREAVQQFPGRIIAIYIRDVSLDERDIEVDTIIQDVGKENVPMLRVADTVAAAEHAIAHQLIDADALPTIQFGKQIDKAQVL